VLARNRKKQLCFFCRQKAAVADPAVAAEVSSLAETRKLSPPLPRSIKLSCFKLRLIDMTDFKAQF
jgi:hypothetical protein